jgi:hypothetical protein
MAGLYSMFDKHVTREARHTFHRHTSSRCPTQAMATSQLAYRTPQIRQRRMKRIALRLIHGLDNPPKSCSTSRTCSVKRENSSPHLQSATRMSPANVIFCSIKGFLRSKLKNYWKRLMYVSWNEFAHPDSCQFVQLPPPIPPRTYLPQPPPSQLPGLLTSLAQVIGTLSAASGVGFCIFRVCLQDSRHSISFGS